ncbi:hypothetical protein COT27_00825 [Candidatus Kuenenbacteria bacterium CG08_land_8_20_14_0_20_37_23]|uniref:Uncharacterized protein n=1 Tax=Candidatus Kuenenbacteria bacterium CG08_land_8_20_14_0_20_37_23 TaxID=1974617 RepID=A0A2M6XTC9_9BACT|nr:MAG: hypothetical protein COT27_00825 [Candidatus Kuenenbacteria bacterium CG08_land_8_20_14_0_20_37_23]
MNWQNFIAPLSFTVLKLLLSGCSSKPKILTKNKTSQNQTFSPALRDFLGGLNGRPRKNRKNFGKFDFGTATGN